MTKTTAEEAIENTGITGFKSILVIDSKATLLEGVKHAEFKFDLQCYGKHLYCLELKQINNGIDIRLIPNPMKSRACRTPSLSVKVASSGTVAAVYGIFYFIVENEKS
ncbi:unnamed protein product [Acanthoscelides obtectus]|uniref:Uncharacterized protein n=1 Tax=Acanthoscelides obtectus TaxID=200917 RepID=A0A9P0K0X6_ACAOB|nr:unnamed protein product [Acanthoscelides obtectus]CAK1654092.1 hypothetical protein AOBTE_LOCUS18448 [Acanthoscelides obtectus]